MEHKKEIWIINGIPGAGKSTTAKALAKQLSASAYIEGDALHEFIFSGKVLPGQEPKNEESRQIHLCVKNQCLLAKSFSDAGFVPIIDYVIINKERIKEYTSQLKGYTTLVVTLNPGVAVALERDAKRPEKTVAHQWVHLDEVMKTNINDVGLWIDNSAMTIDEVIATILQNKDKAVI